MIVILYEMLLSYLEDAKEELAAGEILTYRASLKRVRGCIEELIASLNLENSYKQKSTRYGELYHRNY